MNKRQFIVAISTVIITFIVFLIPMGTTTKDVTGYFVNHHSNIDVKIAIMVVLFLIGAITTVYLKDKK